MTVPSIIWLCAIYTMVAFIQYMDLRGRIKRRPYHFQLDLGVLAGSIVAVFQSWQDHAWPVFAVATTVTILSLLLIIREIRRNKRFRKTMRLIGEKSRARLQAVVDRMRELGTPLPQGSSA
jgi:hypothetical protein